MAIYTFYPCQTDGSAASFEAFDMADETGLAARAAMLLAEHPTCAYVNVWCADRKVLQLGREAARQMSGAGRG